MERQIEQKEKTTFPVIFHSHNEEISHKKVLVSFKFLFILYVTVEIFYH